MGAGKPRDDDASRGFWSWCHESSGLLLFFWQSALWLLAFVALPVLVVLWLYLVYAAMVKPPSWYYSVQARSEVASLSLPSDRETNWRIEGATVCSIEPLAGLAALTGAASPCGGRWQAYTLPAGEEQVLVIGIDGQGPARPVEVTAETGSQRGLQMSLRGGGETRSLGVLRLVDEGIDVALGRELILVWPPDDRPRDLVFPFMAHSVSIGRDVSGSVSAMLQDGRMEIFTASEENPSKRSRIEETQLLPGDQVRLDALGGVNPLQPKGFLRFDRLQPGEAPSTLTAVAFGRAERVRVERFGDSGYDFQPPWWAGITQNHLLVIVTSLIGGIFALLGAHAALGDVHATSPRAAWRNFERHCDGASREGKGEGSA
jgi:hypothetical protein